jgi:hypothetical protein
MAGSLDEIDRLGRTLALLKMQADGTQLQHIYAGVMGGWEDAMMMPKEIYTLEPAEWRVKPDSDWSGLKTPMITQLDEWGAKHEGWFWVSGEPRNTFKAGEWLADHNVGSPCPTRAIRMVDDGVTCGYFYPLQFFPWPERPSADALRRVRMVIAEPVPRLPQAGEICAERDGTINVAGGEHHRFPEQARWILKPEESVATAKEEEAQSPKFHIRPYTPMEAPVGPFLARKGNVGAIVLAHRITSQDLLCTFGVALSASRVRGCVAAVRNSGNARETGDRD